MPDGIAMTPARVARRLRVSRRQVYRWIEHGELPAANVGGTGKRAAWRVFESDLNAFIHARFLDSGNAAIACD